MLKVKGKVYQINDRGREEVAWISKPLEQFPELKELYKKYNIKRLVFDVEGDNKHTVEIG